MPKLKYLFCSIENQDFETFKILFAQLKHVNKIVLNYCIQSNFQQALHHILSTCSIETKHFLLYLAMKYKKIHHVEMICHYLIQDPLQSGLPAILMEFLTLNIAELFLKFKLRFFQTKSNLSDDIIICLLQARANPHENCWSNKKFYNYLEY